MPIATTPPGSELGVAPTVFASLWSRLRGLPVWVQATAWLLLWPVLPALLVLAGHRNGAVRPVGAGLILVVGGSLWLSLATAAFSPSPELVIADEDAAMDETREPDAEPTAEQSSDSDIDAEAELAADAPTADEAAAITATVDGQLEVHFLDVGQGDATLLKHADATVLIDTGRHQASDVVPYLRAAGVDALDLVIVTHPHADHIGQFDHVLESLTVNEVWWSGSTTTSQTFERAVAGLERSTATYEEPRVGDTARIGPLELEIVNPPMGTGLHDLHDASVATRITFGDVRFLFTGDAEGSTEARMVAQSGTSLNADILQLGHHGSNTSTTSGFLATVDPAVAIYSASASNQYGHPHAEVLDRLAADDVDVYGTAAHGTIVVTTNGDDWTITTERTGTPTPGENSTRSSNSSSSGASPASPPSSPSPTESPTPADSADTCRPAQVDLNTAGFSELQRIIHMGPIALSRSLACANSPV